MKVLALQIQAMSLVLHPVEVNEVMAQDKAHDGRSVMDWAATKEPATAIMVAIEYFILNRMREL